MNLFQAKFKCKSSFILGAIFFVTHIGGIFCIVFIDAVWWLKVIITCCILTNLVITVRNYVLLNSYNAVIEFGFNKGSFWFLRKNSTKPIFAFINYPIFVSSNLIIINFYLKNGWRTVSLPIFKDALSADDFRKLKMLLRIIIF